MPSGGNFLAPCFSALTFVTALNAHDKRIKRNQTNNMHITFSPVKAQSPEKNINKKARKPLGKTAKVRKTNIGKTNKQTYKF